MEVLRENQETVLTILQVLLYDPLYVWAISPERNQNDRKGIKGARGAASKYSIMKYLLPVLPSCSCFSKRPQLLVIT
jgi:phosphatidylinositol kinase/protein kinase (PI-3  family)